MFYVCILLVYSVLWFVCVVFIGSLVWFFVVLVAKLLKFAKKKFII